MTDKQNNKKPFFIIGSPRSGTTLLRDLLREHPNLEAPEETHFYRWPEPFATKAHKRTLSRNSVVQKHRKLDGITEDEFANMYKKATSRKELQSLYMNAFLEKRNTPDATWFDKTPQNTYGLLQMIADFPDSKILHVHRNPLNVISSILAGRMVGPESLLGAINIWKEAVKVAASAQASFTSQVMNVSYEKLSEAPQLVIDKTLDFLGQESMSIPNTFEILPANQRYQQILNEDEIKRILNSCSALLGKFGYSDDPNDYSTLATDTKQDNTSERVAEIREKGAELSSFLFKTKSNGDSVKDNRKLIPTTSLYLQNAFDASDSNIDWTRQKVGNNSFQLNKTVVLVRQAENTELAKIKKLMLNDECKLIYILDDNLEAMVEDKNLPDYYRKRISTFTEKKFQIILLHADHLVVSSPKLANIYKSSHKHITMLDPFWKVPAHHLGNSITKKGAGLRIAWLATRSHLKDLHSAWPQISKFLTKYPDSTLTVFVGKHTPKWISNHHNIINREPLSWAEYRQVLLNEQYDVAIHPTVPTEVNKARSISKFFELTSTGAVPVFSKNVSFANRLTNNTNCCLVDDDEWFCCLERLYSDHQSQHRLASAANAAARKMSQSMQIKQMKFWNKALGLTSS